MRVFYLIVFIPLIILLNLLFCGESRQNSTPEVITSAIVSKKNLDKRITVTGKAANSKTGALIIGKNFTLYIHGMDSWPADIFSMNSPLKNVEATGILIEAFDLPVFKSSKNEPIKAGIPVENDKDLRKASHRFLLKNARWKILE